MTRRRSSKPLPLPSADPQTHHEKTCFDAIVACYATLHNNTATPVTPSDEAVLLGDWASNVASLATSNFGLACAVVRATLGTDDQDARTLAPLNPHLQSMAGHMAKSLNIA